MRHDLLLRMAVWVLGLVIGMVQMASPARAERLGFLTLNPATYTSPSGQYRLEVNPGTLYGQGEGTCRVTRDGAEVWSKTLPVTLWQAAIADDGTVAGYGYSHGAEGFAREGQNRDDRPGTFHVVILDPQGKFRLNQAARREESRFEDGLPDPKAEGMWIDPISDRFVVRVEDADVNRNSESWWCYRLSAGLELKRLEPRRALSDKSDALFVCDARPVRGTPLVLVHWYQFQSPEMGAIFTLLDPEGSAVWRLDLPEDYMVRNDEGAQYRLLSEVRRPGVILNSEEPGRFEVRFVAEGKRVTFAVERAPDDAKGKWLVREVGRAPYVAASQPAGVLPVVELRHVGAIALKDGREAPHPIRSVWRFDLDGKGHLGFLRCDTGQKPAFVLVGDGGQVQREVVLEQAKGNGKVALAHVAGQRWVVLASEWGLEAKSEGWWIDADTGKVQPISGLDCPAVESVVGKGDGGFVVFSMQHHRFSIEEEVIAFDVEGHVRWRLPQDYADPEKVCMPVDVAVTAEGQIAVLDQSGQIKLFSAKGKFIRTIDLAKAWQAQPNYLSGMGADGSGLVVYDFDGRPPVWRMSLDGKVTGRLTPHFADGRQFTPRHRLRAGPDGKLWVTDGESLLRLGKDGAVDRVLGRAPRPEQLASVRTWMVDHAGRIYLVDERTSTVHVFDRDGTLLRRCQPLPKDFESNMPADEITVRGDGSVYIAQGLSVGGKQRYLRFVPDGRRGGFEELGIDSINEHWQFVPGGSSRWVAGYEQVYRVDEGGKVVGKIGRRPDGSWLERVDKVAVALDGSAAVACARREGLGQADVAVCVYGADGRPVRTIALPGNPLVLDVQYKGEYILAWLGEKVLLIGADGRFVGEVRVSLPQRSQCSDRPLLSPDGKELWRLSEDQRRIERFALPEQEGLVGKAGRD